MAALGVTDRDRVDDDPGSFEPLDLGGPRADMVLAVGKDDEGPPFGMILVVEGPDRRVERGAEVGPAGLDVAGAEPSEDLARRLEVRGQGTADHPTAGEGDHAGPVPLHARQRLEQARAGLDGHTQTVGHGVLGRHAPADVDEQDHVMPRRHIGAEHPAPPWLAERQHHQSHRDEPCPRPVPGRPARLAEFRPFDGPPTRPSGDPGRQGQEREQQPEPIRAGERLHRDRTFPAS